LLMGYIADTTNHVLPFIIPAIGFNVVTLYAIYLLKGRRQINK
jgi:hypothetical protein